MIKVNNINFYYGNYQALYDVSFQLVENSITALVGPNGAGKSTLMRCLATLERPFNGHIYIDNINIYDHPRQTQQYIGYLSDFFGLYEDLTVEQALIYFTEVRKISKQYMEDTISNLKLTPYRHIKAKALSRGWRQRLGIAQAILHKPKILILDEPASGLDPEARINLSQLFKELQQQGMTLLVSSHILSELEDYATDILIIREGKIIDQQNLYPPEKIEEISFKIDFITEVNDSILTIIQQHNIDLKKQDKSSIIINIPQSSSIVPQLIQAFCQQNIPVYAFYPLKISLQDTYLEKIQYDH